MKLVLLTTRTTVKTVAKRELPLKFQVKGVTFTKLQTIRVGLDFTKDADVLAEAASVGLEFKLPKWAKTTEEVGVIVKKGDADQRYLWCLARGVVEAPRYFFGDREVTDDPDFTAKLPERDEPEEDSLLYFAIKMDNILKMEEI